MLPNQDIYPKLLVGYWHNFINESGTLKLSEVSKNWDVINVSFGITQEDKSTIHFVPYYGTPQSFKEEISFLKSLNKKILLSLGGETGIVILNSPIATQKFITSICELVENYGFDGIDIDLEHGMNLDIGDIDYKNPTTLQHKNLIYSLKEIRTRKGENFMISMAPETAHVQGGISAYGGVWGCYLPIIYAIKDILTYIHVQHYNTGTIKGIDGKIYSQGTADFEVAMAEALINGFVIATKSHNNTFSALPQNQVLIGLPSNPSAAPAGGYISPIEMTKALNYLINGEKFLGGIYVLRNHLGYPNFGGLMAWSINWDKFNNFEFSKYYRSYFNELQQNYISNNNRNHQFISQEKLILYPQSQCKKWEEGQNYIIGDIVTYNQIIYSCIQGHRSQSDWEPKYKYVPALWLMKN